MSIRITWRRGANVEMQVDVFDGGEAFPKVTTWS